MKGLGGGSTPRRRQTEESELEAQNHPQDNAPLGAASPLSAVMGSSGAAASTGKRVVTHDGRSGVVLSSGHGFLAVQIDRAHGGGVTKLRANQLSVYVGKRTKTALSIQAAADDALDDNDAVTKTALSARRRLPMRNFSQIASTTCVCNIAANRPPTVLAKTMTTTTMTTTLALIEEKMASCSSRLATVKSVASGVAITVDNFVTAKMMAYRGRKMGISAPELMRTRGLWAHLQTRSAMPWPLSARGRRLQPRLATQVLQPTSWAGGSEYPTVAQARCCHRGTVSLRFSSLVRGEVLARQSRCVVTSWKRSTIAMTRPGPCLSSSNLLTHMIKMIRKFW